MKLMFCIKSMNSPGGGAERVLAEVSSGLAKRNHEITILSFDPPGGQSFYELHGDIKRLELDLGSPSAPASFRETVLRVAALRSDIREYAPDIVIGFMHSMFIPLSLSMRGIDIPLIASEHVVYDYYRGLPLQKALLHISARLIARMTCVSEQAKHSYPPYMQRKMIVAANPICVVTEGSADALSSARGRKSLLSVGRFEAEKNHDVLIEAFSRIADQVEEWD